MSEQALQAVAEYQAALSPERPAAQDEAAPTAAASESPGKRRYGTASFAAFTLVGLSMGGQIAGTCQPHVYPCRGLSSLTYFIFLKLMSFGLQVCCFII